uniref:Uncharacterized protein n=1 Tax=Anopheles albimanus TaxID=7167 RepID=A0A1I8JSI1_ANOAL
MHLSLIVAASIATLLLLDSVSCGQHCRSDEELLQCGSKTECHCRPGLVRYGQQCLPEKTCKPINDRMDCRRNEVRLKCGKTIGCFCRPGYLLHRNACLVKSACKAAGK